MADSKKKKEEKIISLVDMTVDELDTKAGELAGQIQKKKLELSIGRLKNTREVFLLRKQLAKVKTIKSSKYTVKSTSNP